MHRAHPLSSILAGLLALAAAFAASAQTLYRSVGPDGRVTYSDRAVSDAAGTKPAVADARKLPNLQAAAAASATLPYQLREAASRYPVTLYSGADCAPCADARALLNARGVPFAERTVSSNDDIEALKNLSGKASLPFATVGAQSLHGFSEVRWTQLLDAAGYPKESQLPLNWRAPQALPLVPASAAVAASAASAASAARATSDAGAVAPAPSRASQNPAGIRF